MRWVLAGMLVLAGACPHPTHASDPMQYDKALSLLGSPDTWCRGADDLARSGDAAMIVPLLRAYETRVEGGKLCLLDAMDVLGAKAASHPLYDGPGADDRRMALHLMGLFADDAHLPLLEASAGAADEAVRRQAIRSIATQVQTEAWEAAMIRLLSAEPLDARTQAVTSLGKRRTDTARAALPARLEVEPDPGLRQRIAASLAPSP